MVDGLAIASPRPIRDIVKVFKDGGGRVTLSQGRLAIDAEGFVGDAGLLDELRTREDEALGYFASRRPRRVLPAISSRTRPAVSTTLTSAQLQWIHTDRNPLEEQWLPIVWKLTGVLNVGSFKRSFERLLVQHDILRTRYVATASGARPELDPPQSVQLDVVDLTGLAEQDAEREIWRRMKPKLEKRTPLDQGVVDARLYRITERKHVLAGYIHHIALDATSLAILLGQLMGRYYGGLFGQETGGVQERQYSDFAAWESSWLTDDERLLSDKAWMFDLAGATPSDLAGLDPDTPATIYDIIRFDLPAETFGQASAFARRSGATLNVLFLTALSLALGELNRASHALFGHICHGRPPGFDRAIGSFIQIRPFHLPFGSNDTFADIVQRSRQSVIASSDLRRPVSPQALMQLGIGDVVVNYFRRNSSSQPGESSQWSGDAGGETTNVLGAFTTRSVGRSMAAERPSQIPAFFNPENPFASARGFAQPSANGVRVFRRVPGADRAARPRSMFGISAEMTHLPERLRTEFHRQLHFAVTQADDGLTGVATYRGGEDSRVQTERLVARLIGVLDAGCRNPSVRLAELMSGGAYQDSAT